MAIAEAHLTARFSGPGEDVVGHRVYFVASDGDMMEGLSHEAASLAGHLRLGKLIGIYDDNHISIDGPTTLSFSEDVGARFEAYGWHVVRVDDGNDLAALDAAFSAAREEEDRPSLVIVRTHIGFGSPNKQDTAEAHGAPLGADEVRLARERLGWPADEPFAIPPEARDEWRKARERGEAMQLVWRQRYEPIAPPIRWWPRISSAGSAGTCRPGGRTCCRSSNPRTGASRRARPPGRCSTRWRPRSRS
jgi:transketolase